MLDLLLPWAFALGLLIPMRSLESWLHQHMFKVGWLLTKNLQTTTILYYTFFLPGVVLHEVLLWLVAGVLNVRAEGAIRMPEKQEIAELKLNFVKLDKKVSAFKLAIISIAPLIGGILFIWFVTNNIFDISGFLELASSWQLEDISAAFSRLLATPDFWLWMYLVFAVSATMMPDTGNLRGWRLVVPPIVVVIILFYAIGVGDRVLLVTLQSISQGAYFLIGTFSAVIVVHLVMTGVLGGIESIIERITGDSATFEKGKLIAMRREEILKMRAEQAAKAQKALALRTQPAEKSKTKTSTGGPPSIYRLPLPIPGTPDKEGLLTPDIIVTKDSQGALPGFKPAGGALAGSPAGALPSAVKPAALNPATPAPSTSPTPNPVINPPRSDAPRPPVPTANASAPSTSTPPSTAGTPVGESPRPSPFVAKPAAPSESGSTTSGESPRPSPFAPKPAAPAESGSTTSGESPRPSPFVAKPAAPAESGSTIPGESPRPSPFPPKPSESAGVGAPTNAPRPSPFNQPGSPVRPAVPPASAKFPDDDEEDDIDEELDDDEDEI